MRLSASLLFLVLTASGALARGEFRRACRRRRRPQGGHRDRRAGPSARRARADRRHARLAHRSRRATWSPAGAEIAVVTDQKLALQMQALDSRIASQQSQRDQAKTDYDRIAELQKRGVSTQTQLDQAKTNLDVAERNLTAMRGDRSVIAQQASEGAVLAPGAGRALNVPVSVGQVVLPGETIATLAEDQFILRLQLPERHAQFMRAGDTVLLGARGAQAEASEKLREGKVRLVYPEIRGGRVIADVEVDGSRRLFRRRAHARLHRHRHATDPDRPRRPMSIAAPA